MANPFRRLFRALAFDNVEIGKFVRGNFFKCLGSNQKTRSYTKFLGYSASIAAFGYGVHEEVVRRSRRFEAANPPKDYLLKVLGKEETKRIERSRSHSRRCSFNNFYPHLIQQIPRDWEFLGQYVPKIFAYFVPTASCQEEMRCIDGNKSVCDRDPCPKCSLDARKQCPEGDAKKLCPEDASKCEKCGRTKSEESSSCPQKAKPKPSNKPCKNTGTSSCSQSTDIDIEALSREFGNVKQVEWVAENDLSHCNLIRQASQVTVDSVTRIITETASALEDYHIEFRGVLDNIMDALEETREACPLEQDVIECKLILLRAKADEMRRRIKDLDMFVCSLEKLAMASAEVAFMGHAEYASIAMQERLQSLLTEIKRLRDETKEKERDMLQLQALIIVETGKSLK